MGDPFRRCRILAAGVLIVTTCAWGAVAVALARCPSEIASQARLSNAFRAFNPPRISQRGDWRLTPHVPAEMIDLPAAPPSAGGRVW